MGDKQAPIVGWVIEAASGKYWNGHGATFANFTDAHERAVRFATFDDAEAVRCHLFEFSNLLRSSQHMWVDKP